MRASGLVAGLSLAACSAGLAQEQTDPPNLDWIDRELVAAGEIVLQTGKDDDAVTIDLALRVRASKDAIRRVLAACEAAPEYTPNIVACRRIDSSDDDGQSELFVQTVKPVFFVPRFEHVFRLDYFPMRIEVHRVSGPIAELDGTWWLIDEPDGAVLLVHSLRLRSGLPVPKFFVRSSLRRDLPKILAAVRMRSEAPAGPL
jgi:hypothetical protein